MTSLHDSQLFWEALISKQVSDSPWKPCSRATDWQLMLRPRLCCTSQQGSSLLAHYDQDFKRRHRKKSSLQLSAATGTGLPQRVHQQEADPMLTCGLLLALHCCNLCFLDGAPPAAVLHEDNGAAASEGARAFTAGAGQAALLS